MNVAWTLNNTEVQIVQLCLFTCNIVTKDRVPADPLKSGKVLQFIF